MKPVRVAARALLGGIFVLSGARSAASPEPFTARARRMTDRVAPLLESVHPGLPTDAASLVRVNGTVQLVGGLLLASGRFTRPAAVALAASLVPTTLAGHSFWAESDPAQRAQDQIHFMKNLGLLGGLLLAAADTEGRPSLRWRTTSAVRHGGRTARRAVRTARRDARIAVRSAAVARRIPG